MNKIGQKLSKLLSKNLKFDRRTKFRNHGITEFRTCWKQYTPLKLLFCRRYNDMVYMISWATSQENLPSMSCGQVRHKLACSDIYRSYLKSPKILDVATICIILSSQQITKVLIRLCWCASWSASLLFTCVPCHQKTCLRGLRPGKTQTGLLSYRD